MKLNTKMRYGTRALVSLARHYSQGAVSLAEIARTEQLSEKYLESVFATLRSSGLVRSHRGARGGYELTRPPDSVRLREVFNVLEGPEPYVSCTGDPGACPRGDHCATQHVWAKMYAVSMQVLESTTLADLVACEPESGAIAEMYFI